MNLPKIYTLIFILQVFSPAKVIFTGVAVLLSVCIFLNLFVRSVVYDRLSDS